MFYNFIKLQYQMGKITKEDVMGFVPTFITETQASEIIASMEV